LIIYDYQCHNGDSNFLKFESPENYDDFAYVRMTNNIITSVEAIEQFSQCHSNGGTVLDCAAQTVQEVGISIARDAIIEATGSAGRIVSNTVGMAEQVNQCINTGHSQTACEIGSAISLGATTATAMAARGVITASPLTPLGALTGSVGTYTLLRSGDIGQSFGEITTQLVDYMIDQLPNDIYINPDHPLVIHNNSTALTFASNEVAFVNELVHSNRQVNCVTSEILTVLHDNSDISNVVTHHMDESLILHNNAVQQTILRIDNVRLLTTLDHTLPDINSRLTTLPSDTVSRPTYIPPISHLGEYVKCNNSDGSWSVVFVAVTYNIGTGFSFCNIL